MSRIHVRLVGEDNDVVRRAAADIARLFGGSVTRSEKPTRSGDSLRVYLTVSVPERSGAVFDGWEPPGQRRQWARPMDEERTVAELQARPGEWAHVVTCSTPESARQTASHIRQGKRASYRPAGAYEATHHQAPDGSGQWWVRARYVGGDPA